MCDSLIYGGMTLWRHYGASGFFAKYRLMDDHSLFNDVKIKKMIKFIALKFIKVTEA